MPLVTRQELLEITTGDGPVTLEKDLLILDLAREVLNPYELEDVYNRALGASVSRGISGCGSYMPGDYRTAVYECMALGVTEPHLEDHSNLPFYNR